MSSAAACHLVSHQQTRQFSNKLNFISAQLIITFPQECFGLDDMALRKNSHMAATVWYPMNALMCYQFCMWLLSMWLLLKNTRWTFWGNIHASLTECKTCSRGGEMASVKVQHIFCSNACPHLIFMLPCSIEGIPRRCNVTHAAVAMKTHCSLMYIMYQLLIKKEQSVRWVTILSDWPF